MSNNQNCNNCGAWYGLHQAETMRCPKNGQEATTGKKQEWGETTYENAPRGFNISKEDYEALFGTRAEVEVTTITVSDLIEILQGFDPKAPIVFSSDEEGNGFAGYGWIEKDGDNVIIYPNQ